MSKNSNRISLDKQEFENKLKEIEKHLEPFIQYVTTPNEKLMLKNHNSMKANVLLNNLNNSIESFYAGTLNVLDKYQELKEELNIEIKSFLNKCQKIRAASEDFLINPVSSETRLLLSKEARELLKVVARILAIADMIDDRLFRKLIEKLKENVLSVQNSKTESELLTHFKNYGENFKDISKILSQKINDIQEEKLKNELIGIRSSLYKQSTFLFTTSKILLKHSQHDLAKKLKEQAFTDTFAYIEKINSTLTSVTKSENSKFSLEKSPSLLNLLDELDNKINEMNPIKCKESKLIFNLETQLEDTIKSLDRLLQSDLVDKDRKNKITDECMSLRKALDDLLKHYEKNKDNMNPFIDENKAEFFKNTKSIRRQLRKLIADKFSLITNEPMINLINTAMNGNEKSLNEQISFFNKYASQLIEASLIACSMSNDLQGLQMVEIFITQLKHLLPQVIYAARLLCSFPISSDAQKNMLAFRDAWDNEVNLLILSIDNIISINNFLAVCENNIFDDINKCLVALKNRDHFNFVYSADQITGRTIRVCDIVNAEMDNYEPCDFTQSINSSILILKNKVIPNFAHSVDYASNALRSKPITDPNENEFIDASRLIYDGVRDIRNALLLIPNNDELDDNQSEISDSDDQETQDNFQSLIKFDKNDDLAHVNINLNSEQREKINQQLDSFNKEKNYFDREVLKWDDKSNDIVVLAKKMCVMCMDMTDFMRGRGPLKTTIDIINVAKKISSLGKELEKLVKDLSNECPESQSKRELQNYLNQLPLFCSQLTLTSKVKENVLDPDSASSLIIASKNLMTAVISVVSTSYLASTKYTSKTDKRKPIVQWKMKPPEKKPLIKTIEITTSLIRKGSMRKKLEPVKLLSEFQI